MGSNYVYSCVCVCTLVYVNMLRSDRPSKRHIVLFFFCCATLFILLCVYVWITLHSMNCCCVGSGLRVDWVRIGMSPHKVIAKTHIFANSKHHICLRLTPRLVWCRKRTTKAGRQGLGGNGFRLSIGLYLWSFPPSKWWNIYLGMGRRATTSVAAVLGKTAPKEPPTAALAHRRLELQ